MTWLEKQGAATWGILGAAVGAVVAAVINACR